eukprot:11169425-Lingulodinium_polyedra.AAC.1
MHALSKLAPQRQLTTLEQRCTRLEPLQGQPQQQQQSAILKDNLLWGTTTLGRLCPAQVDANRAVVEEKLKVLFYSAPYLRCTSKTPETEEEGRCHAQ